MTIECGGGTGGTSASCGLLVCDDVKLVITDSKTNKTVLQVTFHTAFVPGAGAAAAAAAAAACTGAAGAAGAAGAQDQDSAKRQHQHQTQGQSQDQDHDHGIGAQGPQTAFSLIVHKSGIDKAHKDVKRGHKKFPAGFHVEVVFKPLPMAWEEVRRTRSE
jgi:hypothetical protein